MDAAVALFQVLVLNAFRQSKEFHLWLVSLFLCPFLSAQRLSAIKGISRKSCQTGRAQGSVLNAFRQSKEFHVPSSLGLPKVKVCSTPFGNQRNFTTVCLSRIGSRTSAQRLSAIKGISHYHHCHHYRHCHVLNAFRQSKEFHELLPIEDYAERKVLNAFRQSKEFH